MRQGTVIHRSCGSVVAPKTLKNIFFDPFSTHFFELFSATISRDLMITFLLDILFVGLYTLLALARTRVRIEFRFSCQPNFRTSTIKISRSSVGRYQSVYQSVIPYRFRPNLREIKEVHSRLEDFEKTQAGNFVLPCS